MSTDELLGPAGSVSVTAAEHAKRTRRADLVRWSRIFIRAGPAFVVALIATIVTVNALRGLLHLNVPIWARYALLITDALVGVGVGMRASRSLTELPVQPLAPPNRSPIDQRLRGQARSYSLQLAMSVGAATICVGFVIVALVLGSISDSAIDRYTTVASIAVVVLSGLLSAGVAELAQREYHAIAQRQLSRRAIPSDLTQRAKQAQQAMEQAAFLADELQDEIHVHRRVLAEIQRELVNSQVAATVSRAQAESVARVLAADRQQDRRRSFWSGLAVNVAVGFVFYVLGFLTPALVSTESLRTLLHSWLRLG